MFARITAAYVSRISFGSCVHSFMSWCGAPHQLMNEWTHDPKEILETYAAVIRANMLTYSIWPGNYFLVIPKQHRQIFAAAGWGKKDIREYVHERARVQRGDWRSVGKAAVAGRSDEARVYT